jgi:hypothetical protein
MVLVILIMCSTDFQLEYMFHSYTKSTAQVLLNEFINNNANNRP